MSAKAIREADGKAILAGSLKDAAAEIKFAAIGASDLQAQFERAEEAHPWLLSSRLVAKPDVLLKRRGKAGLVLLDADWEGAKQWIAQNANTSVSVDSATGTLGNFVAEPFVKHDKADEHYVCIRSHADGDEILFSALGGIDVGSPEDHAVRWLVPASTGAMAIGESDIADRLPGTFAASKAAAIARFISALYQLFVAAFFTYLEINPIAYVNDAVHVLDIAARVDSTAEYLCAGTTWPRGMAFPAPFGREMTPEEALISRLDASTGASLKLTVLNPAGRVWTMVAGGGASVAYADAIVNHGYAHELANYGEYSGAPSEAQTYEYARTVIDLMTRGEPAQGGKVLLIGGGIANFTNVAATFRGIIRALQGAKERLVAHGVRIWVRRGGPNYQEGLRMMRELSAKIGVPISVHGPETHITAIVPMALASLNSASAKAHSSHSLPVYTASVSSEMQYEPLFSETTQAIVFGLQTKAVQSMLDFDYMSGRETPSVAAVVSPFDSRDSTLSVFYGPAEVSVPVYTTLAKAVANHPAASVLVNFASFRSVFQTVSECIANHAESIKTIAVIAEGVPERMSRQLGVMARQSGVTIIGPATVGGVRAGAFKIGNTGGMIDNIEAARLYRPGSVCYVSKSGGMSNEMNSMMALEADGVAEGIAIGGDHFPGTTFADHLMRYEADPACKILVLLGEVGGDAEYAVARAIQSGRIAKPLVAWVMGTSADALSKDGEFQFGHAGAMANGASETAMAKNAALRDAGAHVPPSFEDLPAFVHALYAQMVAAGAIAPSDKAPRPVPMDYDWARELGLIRKKANMVSTISDDRGAELRYAGVPISTVVGENYGIGGALALLWFRRALPKWATDFLEMVVVLTADHGPAVSGAHNTIVAARAGKDLVSALASGLLTIGDRFGGALDEAAAQFTAAYDAKQTPAEFVGAMRKQNRLISGIGHKVKSKTNPDMRVTLIKDYAARHFPAHPLLDYALAVEAITTSKKDNLILNVDGATAVLLVDMLRHGGCFTAAEADEYVKYGFLNGLFVTGRTIGFIGHFIDQRRNNQPLYRHPWEDIRYGA